MNIAEGLSRKDRKRLAAELERENAKLSHVMQRIESPRLDRTLKKYPIECWRSRYFLCQVYKEDSDMERLSICRTSIDIETGRFKDGLTWDHLQAVKAAVGRGDFDAVEVFPRNGDVVNVANMRHLWVFKGKSPDFIWRQE